MSIRNIIKVLSIVLLIIAGFMLIPLIMAYYLHETAPFKGFIITIALIIIISSIVLIIERNNKINDLTARDGFIFVTFAWISASLFSCLPFIISKSIPSITDAYFEAMSGYSTTGASILIDIEILPRSILFWRSLTHWLGGMGIVVLTVAILPMLGIGGIQLIKAEAPGPSMDKISPRISGTAKKLWYIYIGLTIIQTILLVAGKMSLFDALTHTFGSLSGGGFSIKNKSVGHYDSAYIQGVITFFMLLGGMNFSLHYKFITGKISQFLRDQELRVYILIFIISSLLITFNLMKHEVVSFNKGLQYSTFQVASILTTTGFATADYELWPYFSQTILFLIMFIGGCSGSTSGNIKVIRFMTLFKKGFNEMKYLLHPSGVFTLKVNGHTVRKDIAYAISGFFFLYILILLITTLVVSTADVDIVTSLTTSLAALGNIGPGFGLIGPTENYHFFPAYVKWFLSLAMMIGRLELYTVLVLFTRTFWANR
ncbi:MAG: TrkH family potassium uptake protein [Spirochaetes bacterium]|nr:TrkH family potassium uptake protein [Spirochaetota bacterium]